VDTYGGMGKKAFKWLRGLKALGQLLDSPLALSSSLVDLGDCRFSGSVLTNATTVVSSLLHTQVVGFLT
jgi:hypothetical protein